MGGTFDPIHNGHLVAASEVADYFALDEVIFVPTGQPWQKGRDVTAAEDRYLMTVIATASNPRFSVSRVDIDRGGPTFTTDTLRDLRTTHPEAKLYFITGADALASILTWQGWEELFELATFIGVSRPGYELTDSHITEAFDRLPDDAAPHGGTRTGDLLDRLPHSGPGRVDRSGTLVPDGVVQYVAKRRLYRGRTAPVEVERDRLGRSDPDGGSGSPRGGRETRAGHRGDRRVGPVGDHRLLCDRPRPPTSARSTPSSMRSRRRCGSPGTNRPGGKVPVRGRWVLLDYVDIVVHIQHTDERNFYALDRLWRDCPLVDVDFGDVTADPEAEP